MTCWNIWPAECPTPKSCRNFPISRKKIFGLVLPTLPTASASWKFLKREASFRRKSFPAAGPGAGRFVSGFEAAVRNKSYTTSANGVIEGTTVIQGIKVGFRGKMIGDEVRVATVFTKR